MVERMFATMEKFGGIGLAANQVGLLGRVIIGHASQYGRRGQEANSRRFPSGDDQSYRIVLIRSKPDDDEGCLSFPGVR